MKYYLWNIIISNSSLPNICVCGQISEDVECMGNVRSTYNISIWKPEGKRPLVRPICQWEGSIKMDYKSCGLVSAG
jgi:hypothetical protein